MTFDEEISVANSALGTDLLSDWEDNQVGYNRYIVGAGLVGANAVGEEEVAIRVGGKKVDTVRTQATGLGMLTTQILASRTKVPAGTRIMAVVEVAPTVSPTRLRLIVIP